jgi:hypothetical protein
MGEWSGQSVRWISVIASTFYTLLGLLAYIYVSLDVNDSHDATLWKANNWQMMTIVSTSLSGLVFVGIWLMPFELPGEEKFGSLKIAGAQLAFNGIALGIISAYKTMEYGTNNPWDSSNPLSALLYWERLANLLVIGGIYSGVKAWTLIPWQTPGSK